MSMRLLAVIVAFLLVLIQYPLWLGKGGWFHLRDLTRQLAAQEQQNEMLYERNRRLAKEVQDLKDGSEATEEYARFEIGMIQQGEYFVQFIPPVETPK